MKRPSFLAGAGAGLVLATGGGVAFALLLPAVSAGNALRIVVSLLGFAYLLWLFRGSRRRTGRVTAAAGWLLVSAGAWFSGLAPAPFLLVHAAAIWFLRSLFRYAGVLPALMDLAVTALGALAAAWALAQSRSVFLAAWCFFLVQALVAAIPARLPRGTGKAANAVGEEDAFEQARRHADAAFRQLIGRAGG